MEGESEGVSFEDLDAALVEPETQLRLFGKPGVSGRRRMGVALARGDDIEQARAKARQVASAITAKL